MENCDDPAHPHAARRRLDPAAQDPRAHHRGRRPHHGRRRPRRIDRQRLPGRLLHQRRRRDRRVLSFHRRRIRSVHVVRDRRRADRDAVVRPRPRAAAAPVRRAAAVAVGLPRRRWGHQRGVGSDRLVGRGGVPLRRHRPAGRALRLRPRQPVVREQWVATGAIPLCAGQIIVSARSLPSWLGCWAIIAGIGQVLARAIWTEGVALAPGTAYWIWVVVLSVLLLLGRFAVAGAER
jgi:hypothetical protein